ncbi:MAG: YodL domain-containing protein [Eubacteriales bacterium]|jgi:hypothetical protein
MSRDIVKWDEVNGRSEPEKIEAFLTDTTDTYAILQLRYDDETRDERFESYSALKRAGREPDIDHYEVIYTAPLLPYLDQNVMLENMYEKFNIDRPEDFHGHSLSVSDVVMLRQNGMITAHYVDSVGFTPLDGFYSQKNHIRTLEDMLEQNDNMLDGVVNNLPDEAVPCKCEKKESVLDQLNEMKEKEEPPFVGIPQLPDRNRE